MLARLLRLPAKFPGDCTNMTRAALATLLLALTTFSCGQVVYARCEAPAKVTPIAGSQ
jgi:hypothetical protein